MVNDARASRYTDDDDDELASGTAITIDRAAALDTVRDDIEPNADQHVALAGLATDVAATLDALQDQNPDDKQLAQSSELVQMLHDHHEVPTPFTGHNDEGKVWADAFRVLSRYDDAYDQDTVRDLADDLAGEPDYHRSEAWSRVETWSPAERAEIIQNADHTDRLTVADAAQDAANVDGVPPWRQWEIFKEAAGYDPAAFDRAWEAFGDSGLQRPAGEANAVASRMRDRDVYVSVGEYDPDADYTILSANDLVIDLRSAMLRQMTENGQQLRATIEQGVSPPDSLLDGMERETRLAEGISASADKFTEQEYNQTWAQIRELDDLLNSDMDDTVLLQQVRQLMDNHRSQERPALEALTRLNDEYNKPR